MDEQERVARFVAEYDLSAPPAFRLLDLVSEVGELAKAAAETTAYGDRPGAIEVPEDELGDALFSLLALADGLDLDAGEALAAALSKYERRLEERGEPSSGE